MVTGSAQPRLNPGGESSRDGSIKTLRVKLNITWLWLKARLAPLFEIDFRTLAFFRIFLGSIILFDFFCAILSAGAGFQVFHLILAAVFALGMMVGYQTRLMTFFSWVMIVLIQNLNLIILNSDAALIRFLLFWSIFLPTGARFSIDHALNVAVSKRRRSIISPASCAILLQAALIFFFANWPGGAGVSSYQRVIIILLFCPIFMIPTRAFAILGFILLQIGFTFTPHDGLPYLVSICGILLFIPGAVWNGLGQKIKLHLGPTSSSNSALKIYYDGDCTFCRKMAFILKAVLNIEHVRILPARAGTPIRQVMDKKNSWVVVTPSGQSFFHYEAFLNVLRYSTLGQVLLPLFKSRPATYCGERVYKFIANHRGVFSEVLTPFKLRVVNYRPSRLNKILSLFFMMLALLFGLQSISSLNFRVNQEFSALARLSGFEAGWNPSPPVPLRKKGLE